VDHKNPIDYNLIAPTYATQRNASALVIEHILEQLQPNSTYHVLEVGCGTADHLFALSRFALGRYFGFDLSNGMIKEGLSKNPGLYLACSNADSVFPYPGRSFDFAFSINVIHYIGDLNNYFNELYRILKPGGIALTVTDSDEDLRHRTMAIYFPETIEPELKRYHPIERLVSAMSHSGFKNSWITHGERLFQLDTRYLVQCKNKAFSAIRLLAEGDYQLGMARLGSAIKAGKAEGRELHTFIWGLK
jgi:SAM-dependent methyltransferase